MKLIAVIFALLTSFSSVAGPEEHMQLQTCYRIVRAQDVNPFIPIEICVEDLTIDPVRKKLSVESYFYAKLYKGMRLTSLNKSRDGHNFKAKNVIAEGSEGLCKNSQVVTLQIAGKVDPRGKGDLDKLSIEVIDETAIDACHGRTHREVHKYRHN